jgi:uncharacterized membrane-anchored protein
MSVDAESRRTLGTASTAGAVAACAACCAPPVIGLLGVGTGAAAVLSAALAAGLVVALLVALLVLAALTGVHLVRRSSSQS